MAELVIAEDRLTGVGLRTGEVVPRDTLVAASVVHTHAELLRGLGLETEDTAAAVAAYRSAASTLAAAGAG